MINLKAHFVTRDKVNNLNQESKEFLYYPVILNADFDKLGKFNIVVLTPEGLGSAFYTGWAKPGKFNRTWTLPIEHKFGEWNVVLVFTPKEGGINHVSLTGILNERTTVYSPELLAEVVSKKEDETAIPMELIFPNKDITMPYPYLWISGKSSNNFEISVQNKNFKLSPVDNTFLLPIKLDFGSYSVIDISGGKGTSGFQSTFSIFSIKGTIDSEINSDLYPISIIKNFSINKIDKSESAEIKSPNSDKVLYEWELPVEDLCSTKKFQLIKGWAELDSEIIVDGNTITVKAIDNGDDNSPTNIGTFEYFHPIRIGLNELEIKVTDKSGKVARENRFIECILGKLSFDTINVNKKVETHEDSFRLSGQITPSSTLMIDGEDISTDENGFFKYTVQLIEFGSNVFEISLEKNQNIENEYSLMRNGIQKIKDLSYISENQKLVLETHNISTINDLFEFDMSTADLSLNYKDFYLLHKYLGFLLLGKDNLGIFSELEAFLISKTDLKSIEELIQADPFDLIEELNKMLKEINNELKEFSIGDANRWQRTLDDLLLEYQEDYLID